MPLYQEGYREKEKSLTARMVRSQSQDAGRKFKTEPLRWMYPKKLMGKDKIDIGLICTKWQYAILTFFKPDPEFLDTVLPWIRLSYLNGENLDEDELFGDYIAIYGTPLFAYKIDVFPVLANLSFMGNLEKPQKIREDHDDFNW